MTEMEMEIFKYAGIGHPPAGVGYVLIKLIKLERRRGVQFDVCLTAEDAQQMIDDLRVQIRIATPNSN